MIPADELARPVRVQLSRKKGWRMPPNTVAVSRPWKWGNPYAIGKPYRTIGAHTDYVVHRAHAVDLFRRAITGKLEACYLYSDTQAWGLFAAQVKRDLRGKNLACWCPLDQPCHADVLLEIANAP